MCISSDEVFSGFGHYNLVVFACTFILKKICWWQVRSVTLDTWLPEQVDFISGTVRSLTSLGLDKIVV